MRSDGPAFGAYSYVTPLVLSRILGIDAGIIRRAALRDEIRGSIRGYGDVRIRIGAARSWLASRASGRAR